MKKLLLATTAIAGIAFAAPAVIADEATDSPVVANPHFKVSIGGEMRFLINWTDSQIRRGSDDGAATANFARGYQFATDESEIHVKADAVSDFGLKYGLKVELLTNADDGDNNADEVMAYFAGTWGRLEVGNDDDAADGLAVGGEDVMAGFGGYDSGSLGDIYNFGQTHEAVNDGGVGDFGANNNPIGDRAGIATMDGGQVLVGPGITPLSDATKITYFTPSIYGFTFGVSFTPDSGHNGDAALNDRTGNFENVTSLGLEYKRDFGKLGFVLSGVYVTGENEDDLTPVAAIPGNAIEALNAYQIGTKLSYAGFELAAAYADFDDSGISKADAAGGADAGQWWDVGLSYATGPWKVSTGYYHFDRKFARNDITAGVDNEVENSIYSISATYNLAPGLALKSDVNFIDNSYIDNDVTGAVADVNRSNDGTVFLIGTQVKF